MKKYWYIATGDGNLFIEVELESGEKIHFFMSIGGKHLDGTREFHTEAYYKKCIHDWGKTEAQLPEEMEELANDIVDKYLGIKKLTTERVPNTPFANLLTR